MTLAMNRIRVVGTSGSGKSTTAMAIARALDIPYLELDAVHWLPDWQERDPDQFRQMVLEFATQARWVIDGTTGVAWAAASTAWWTATCGWICRDGG